MAKKIDTRAIGLDVSLSVARWLTGEEHLHYGLWNGLDVNASNLKAAQAAYTENLLSHLPEGTLRILDIGGGAGATARELLARRHSVEIVVPSAILAERCRANAPEAVVHEMKFEDFAGEGPFDLCLFSESFQYIPLDKSLPRCFDLLASGGHVLIADCFRTETHATGSGAVGGGWRLSKFDAALAELPYETLVREDLTEAVAPSVEIEQAFYNIVGDAALRLDQELKAKRPWLRGMIAGVVRVILGKRRQDRLARRLTERTRTAEAFIENNRYLLVKLRRT
ncbi:MAG: methyltransferase domain-containing protein [Paracoccaceae bacterium]|nr:methyltransferase domain-containing protein [Paracoccaceae bacterium]